MKRNETKMEILSLLTEGVFSSRELYSKLGEKEITVSLQAVRMGVQRLKKWNLIKEDSKIKGTKEVYYSITEKGKNRLQWLLNQQKGDLELTKNSAGFFWRKR